MKNKVKTSMFIYTNQKLDLSSILVFLGYDNL